MCGWGKKKAPNPIQVVIPIPFSFLIIPNLIHKPVFWDKYKNKQRRVNNKTAIKVHGLSNAKLSSLQSNIFQQKYRCKKKKKKSKYIKCLSKFKLVKAVYSFNCYDIDSNCSFSLVCTFIFLHVQKWVFETE